ncbi:MAG: hypothetical protein IH914_01700 [candidate division Zixibacteria bacterium]|nr:hypothetical protein [candidate division Zixibacteria bacterium]
MKKPTTGATLKAAFAFLACALWITGCSENTLQPLSAHDSGPTDLSKIADQLVPEKYRDSSPGARPYWEALQQDEMIDDPLLADVLAASDSVFDVFSVRIIWGTLNSATTVISPPTNWSGGVGMNAAGFIAVRALIDFEPGQDALLPREFPTLVRWRSITNHDIDGIHILIFHPKNVVYIVAPDLTFKTEQATIVVPLFSLAKLDTVVRVDEHNAIAMQAHKVTDRDCPHGLLGGHWTFKSMNSGHFLGKWISADGQLMGFLGGEFGENDGGTKFFRGKWVDVEGVFQGRLRGRWGFHDSDGSSLDCPTCDDSIGWFSGQFTGADGTVRGSMKGRFVRQGGDAIISPHPPGTFFGRWKVICVDNSDG